MSESEEAVCPLRGFYFGWLHALGRNQVLRQGGGALFEKARAPTLDSQLKGGTRDLLSQHHTQGGRVAIRVHEPVVEVRPRHEHSAIGFYRISGSTKLQLFLVPLSTLVCEDGIRQKGQVLFFL